MTTTDARLAVLHAWHASPAGYGLSPAGELSDAFSVVAGVGDRVFDVEDLRESEIHRLDELAAAAIVPIRDDTERRILDALAGVVEQFMVEFPDAPRRVVR
jgi:hypothetical protein